MQLNNTVYDILKWIVVIFLPADGAAYYGLAQLWMLPYVEQVVGTIVVAATFLGALIGISTTTYNKKDGGYDGVLMLESDEENRAVYSFVLHDDPELLVNKDKLNIKVSPRRLAD